MSFLNSAGEAFGPLAQAVMDMFSSLGLTTIGGQFLFLAGIAAIAVLIFFAVGALVSTKSKTKKDIALYKSATAFIADVGEIDDKQVEELNSYMTDMPNAVQKGWADFLEQKVSYPSDYFNEEEIFSDKRYASEYRLGKTLYAVLAAIAALAVVFLSALVSAEFTESSSLFAANTIVPLIFEILSVIILPLIVYICLYAVLGAIYRKQDKQAVLVFREFAAALDGAVVLFRETKSDDEFLAENVEVINEEIERIIANKIEQNEIIDIVTTPKQAEEEIAAAMPAELEEIAPAPAVDAPAPMTREEEESQLLVLVTIVEKAIADVRGTTKEDLEELAELIYNAKESGFDNPKDQEVLTECLHKLSDLYYR